MEEIDEATHKRRRFGDMNAHIQEKIGLKTIIRQHAQTPLTFLQPQLTYKATFSIVSLSSSKHTFS